ncbi:MAG: GNAT family N-acetyltransferase [Pseudomonadota bacterium]
MDPALTLRRATQADAPRLLAWRNDPATRAASLVPTPVAPRDHAVWLTRTLNSKKRSLWIAEVADLPVGTTRLDISFTQQELSWTIAPEARGKGYGKAMVRAALEQITGPVRARIRPENKASQAIARACGFSRVFVKGGVETWLFRPG